MNAEAQKKFDKAIQDLVRKHALACNEKQFQPGMSWVNCGENGWEIDHIRPCASFDLEDPRQQKTCFHYSNLQPLWAIDNQRKGATLPV